MFDLKKTVKLSMVALKHMATLKLPNRGQAKVAIKMIMIAAKINKMLGEMCNRTFSQIKSKNFRKIFCKAKII